MRVPRELPADAKAFWQRNAPRCLKLGTLTDADTDTFTLLCLTWERISRAITDDSGNIEFVCLLKQYQNLSKLFGLDPVSRKKLGIVTEVEEVDQFGL